MHLKIVPVVKFASTLPSQSRLFEGLRSQCGRVLATDRHSGVSRTQEFGMMGVNTDGGEVKERVE